MINDITIIWRIFLIIILAPLIITAWWVFFMGAPWAPSRKKDYPRILKIASPYENDLVYELGCGDGRVCTFLARNCNVRVIGFEISLLPYLIAKLRIFLSGLNKKVKIKYKNFYKEDLSQANIVFCYLTPRGLKKLNPKLEKELRPGVKIISYAYAIEGWQPDLKDWPAEKEVPIYLYIKK